MTLRKSCSSTKNGKEILISFNNYTQLDHVFLLKGAKIFNDIPTALKHIFKTVSSALEKKTKLESPETQRGSTLFRIFK